ncbi:MAG: bifunctional phosphopantothenoylcysteine decarboxylase/phosphopantothenate--cysteine ligase CoaBC [Bryobacterales bacterium]|nr:bifunctional phosphopantothenoylcysteine decarboxylase/phosphopantothenate--cysteine ligase CoaBC [Bryobacterales bacterium]
MNVALGVGGGIAAYKAAELARALMERGFTVDVVMTRAAEEFIRPLTFAALTGRKVHTQLFSAASADDTLSSAIDHMRIAQEHELMVVAPATADLIAKFANGLADDLLTTTYLAFTGIVVVAPAMNTSMWNHPATQANMAKLRERGHVIVEPGEGLLACGVIGPGRLAEPEVIAEAVLAASRAKQPRQDLEGETILLTAGPTQEPIDGVRYISNRSSGKMGYAIAEEAAARGARVVLISGPVNLAPPKGVTMVAVRTALEMRQAVMDHLNEATIVIKAAAVADYHVANAPAQKVKKTAARLSLDLEPTPDILAEVGSKKGDRLVIGFAAETGDLVAEARRKLEQKNCDMIVGNVVSQPGAGEPATGFESDDNAVVLVTRSGETIPVERASKRAIAARILDEALRVRLALHASH